MDKSFKQKLVGIPNAVETSNLEELAPQTGSTYASLVIISQRANQISQSLKHELHGKLEEFASHTDNLEEVMENREQIEISKFYEKLPHPTLIATHEFLDGDLFFHHKSEEETAD